MVNRHSFADENYICFLDCR